MGDSTVLKLKAKYDPHLSVMVKSRFVEIMTVVVVVLHFLVLLRSDITDTWPFTREE